MVLLLVSGGMAGILICPQSPPTDLNRCRNDGPVHTARHL